MRGDAVRLAQDGMGNMVLRQAMYRLSQERHLKNLATGNPLAQRMARRFVAGETLDEALIAVSAINRQRMTATLDYLGENVRTIAEAEEATNALCAMLRSISEVGVQCNVSLKLTQLGLDLGSPLAQRNLERVLEQAAELDNFIRIDMESSDYVDRTLQIFFDVFERRKNVGVVIQSCLYRSEIDLERLIQAGARVRLVKGAYLEPTSVAFQRKEDVDAGFAHLMRMLLARGNYPAIATHDPAMIAATRDFARQQQIPASRYEFQMLYGVRRDLQHQLVQQGYGMRIYVPFGTYWYPYLMRRLAERPANVMFVLSNVAREASTGRR